jgi:putative ABC transport system permease protein
MVGRVDQLIAVLSLRALNRKLLRECWHLKGQMLSIALVVATGIMTVVTMRGSYESLVEAQQRYYNQMRFADVWTSLRRAPDTVLALIENIPGVALADSRVSFLATLDLEGVEAPAQGRFVSIPENGRPVLNDIQLTRGRLVAPGAPDEVVISEKFALARGLQPGDTLRAIINGRARTLDIVGMAISPEHSYSVPPGSLLPEDDRYGILWMGRRALGPAYDMDGAFNEAFVKLAPGANELAVIAQLNELLAPYGGFGAYPRRDQASHMMLQGELDQNRVMGTAMPAIFLGVAVFLLHLVLGRLITTQRGEIAVLKAFGYRDWEVGRHFLMFAVVAVLVGSVIGTVGGWYLGGAYIGIYRQYFDLPGLEYHLSPTLLLFALGVSVAGACSGALGAVRKAVALPPAEAMRPEPPARFEPGPLERLGIGRLLPSAGRMILRNVERKPLQAFFSSLGVAFSTAILIIGLFMYDGVLHMIDLQFRQIQREDITVSFLQNVTGAARHELQRMEGVTRVETYRMAPARLRNGHFSRETAIQGMEPDGQLRRIVTASGGVQQLPADGLVLSRILADRLRVQVGDVISVEMLEGRRQVTSAQIAGIVEDFLGVSAYMNLQALHRLTGEQDVISGAYLAVMEPQRNALYRDLKQVPAVAGVASPASMLVSFEREMARNIFISVGFLVGFASVIAVGVIYNGARIALSERGRELASLRVMGFHRREVAVLLLGEQAVITLLAIPLGGVIGYALAWLMVSSLQTDTFRIPYVITAQTFLAAAAVTVAAAALSALAVRRRLDSMDLISVLKTRE